MRTGPFWPERVAAGKLLRATVFRLAPRCEVPKPSKFEFFHSLLPDDTSGSPDARAHL